MRGRKPKPTTLRLLAGNPGKRPAPRDEPKPELITPEVPSWLDADAKAEWSRLVPELEKLQLLTLIDRDTLAAYCDAVSEWKQANEIIQHQGLTLDTLKGGVQAHPAVAIRRNAREAVRKFAALFGFDPADRARIHAPKKEPKDPFNEFLGKRA